MKFDHPAIKTKSFHLRLTMAIFFQAHTTRPPMTSRIGLLCNARKDGTAQPSLEAKVARCE